MIHDTKRENFYYRSFRGQILKSHVKAYEHWVNPAEIETDIKNLLSQFRNLDEL